MYQNWVIYWHNEIGINYKRCMNHITFLKVWVVTTSNIWAISRFCKPTVTSHHPVYAEVTIHSNELWNFKIKNVSLPLLTWLWITANCNNYDSTFQSDLQTPNPLSFLLINSLQCNAICSSYPSKLNDMRPYYYIFTATTAICRLSLLLLTTPWQSPMGFISSNPSPSPMKTKATKFK